MPDKVIYVLIFLPMIITIGVLTSFEDFKLSKIRNKWVLLGILYSLLVYVTCWALYGIMVSHDIAPIIQKIIMKDYLWRFDKWCINLVMSTMVAYLFWSCKIWGAGDAKLFIAFSALIPMRQYSITYFNYNFASFLLLISIFLPVTLFLFLRAVVLMIKENKLREIMFALAKFSIANIPQKEILNSLKVFFGFFCLFLCMQILRFEFLELTKNIIPDLNIILLISLLMFRPLSRFFKKFSKFFIAVFLMLILNLIFKSQEVGMQSFFMLANSLKKCLVLVTLFLIIQKTIYLFERKEIHKNMPFAPWMFLGALITWFI